MDNIEELIHQNSEDIIFSKLINQFNNINKKINEMQNKIDSLDKDREIIVNKICKYLKIEN